MTANELVEPLQLILYAKPGCHLCEETHSLVRQMLMERSARGLRSAELVERNIETDEVWYRDFFETIPVLAMEGLELPLAIEPPRIRAFLDVTLGSERVTVR